MTHEGKQELYREAARSSFSGYKRWGTLQDCIQLIAKKRTLKQDRDALYAVPEV
jgi:hypothetical protein